jgi:UDP-N-acetylmuramate--alanine ligase
VTQKQRHVHFVGVGGIGVSGIAQLALRKGDVVSGSDLKRSLITDKLAGMGAEIFIGHAAENVAGADLVVYSSAIRSDNPEIVAARSASVPLKRRAEFLSDLMKDQTVVTITGAHGKTTTSSLSAKLLTSAGFCPTVAVGGILREDGDNVKCGDSRYFVAEADESDGSFLCYAPTYSIITNIDLEHMDFYKTYENLLASFDTFIGQTKPNGCLFYCREDKALHDLVARQSARSTSYGFSPDADIWAENIVAGSCRLSFSCRRKDGVLGDLALRLAGRHNVLNALAVVALGLELGISFDLIRSALGDFKGVERRFQVKHDDKDLLVVDDYGHHPTEIAATIAAARACGRSRVVTVFQPHRYTRTRNLMEQFARCFAGSDQLIITDIYAASEPPLEGVSALHMVDAVKRAIGQSVVYMPKDEIVIRLRAMIQPGDLVLFLGAGDITRTCDEFAKGF